MTVQGRLPQSMVIQTELLRPRRHVTVHSKHGRKELVKSVFSAATFVYHMSVLSADEELVKQWERSEDSCFYVGTGTHTTAHLRNGTMAANLSHS